MPHNDNASSQSHIVQLAISAQRMIDDGSAKLNGDSELQNYYSVIEELPLSEWTPHKIGIAIQLAKLLTYQEKLQVQMESEGPVIQTVKGPIVNPIIKSCEAVLKNITTTRSMLAINESLGKPSRRLGDIKKARGNLKQIEGNAVETVNEEDGLIPGMGEL